MARFFELLQDEAVVRERYSGEFDAAHKWGLPGANCHTCGAIWGVAGHQYPAVDLSQLPERKEFEEARPEPFSEFARLRELVRPLAPPNSWLPPGTTFGPLVGRAFGKFGPFTSQGNITWLVLREALERLQAEGVRGLVGCRTELRFRTKTPPDVLELQIEPWGRLHPDCIPPDVPPPCPTCGRHGFRLPDEPILDTASLPTELDLFRVGNFSTVIVGTERFMETVRRLELDGITFRELPTR
ncbi:double-CXXCG motif protein [Pyxidicoccus caerfyrddinensis]|uniref:SitI6 family double-CXXCG motif immunity protein n=1 Tax=Pyxidicoccus caerfyrddinensis TaxID=2709663 RepID=UPI0013DB4693|nr:double-CXXCG motif protein [Pyxidicoccus caerfyrddinensis]